MTTFLIKGTNRSLLFMSKLHLMVVFGDLYWRKYGLRSMVITNKLKVDGWMRPSTSLLELPAKDIIYEADGLD
jgi:hypothetical protein